VNGERITVVTTDGREHSVSLAWEPLLSDTTPEQRANYELQDFGTAVHWPDVDEDIGLAAFPGVDEDTLREREGLVRGGLRRLHTGRVQASKGIPFDVSASIPRNFTRRPPQRRSTWKRRRFVSFIRPNPSDPARLSTGR